MTKQLERLINKKIIKIDNIIADIDDDYCMCELVSKYKLTVSILKEISTEFCANKSIFSGLSQRVIKNSKPLDIDELKYLYLE